MVRIRIEEEEFSISESGAALSATLKKMMDDGAADVITLSNICSSTFPMIIAYLEAHAAAAGLSDQEKWKFNIKFASGEDYDILRKLTTDAETLEIQGLPYLLSLKMGNKNLPPWIITNLYGGRPQLAGEEEELSD